MSRQVESLDGTIVCKRCGKPAKVTYDGIYEVECESCHIAEYGETLEKAARCFDEVSGEAMR